MNYGYAPLHDHSETVKLDETDEPNRYFIQLYHHVVSAVDLTNLDVLEIGSGRGGGASYINRYLKPKALTGVDFSDKAIQFCKYTHDINGLSFIKGDAESLSFDAGRFDVRRIAMAQWKLFLHMRKECFVTMDIFSTLIFATRVMLKYYIAKWRSRA
jgi:SAM-dependent methyltransferase